MLPSENSSFFYLGGGVASQKQGSAILYPKPSRAFLCLQYIVQPSEYDIQVPSKYEISVVSTYYFSDLLWHHFKIIPAEIKVKIIFIFKQACL